MFSWLRNKVNKPNHPLGSPDAVRDMLDALPQDGVRSLQQITEWIVSITSASGFTSRQRSRIVKLLDEAAQPGATVLLRKYLASPLQQDLDGMAHWEGLYRFTDALTEAYDACLKNWNDSEDEDGSDDHQETAHDEFVLIGTRLLRAAGEHIKLGQMRYLEVKSAIWTRMYRCYRQLEEAGYARHMIYLYSGTSGRSNPKQELMRALAMTRSSTGNLTPAQIEVCARVIQRMSSYFDLTTAPDISTEYYIDLARPQSPRAFEPTVPHQESLRYFTMLRSVQQISSIIRQHEQEGHTDERRFGGEFTPDGKLTVLQHLRRHWNKHAPQRQHERRAIRTRLTLVGGFRNICAQLEYSTPHPTFGLTEKEAAALYTRLPSQEQTEKERVILATEDASLSGVGGKLVQPAPAWMQIGVLCAVKAENTATWWLGIIRRSRQDEQGNIHIGIEILSRRPVTVWLRSLGDSENDGWDDNTGSFRYTYYPAIMLPDARQSFLNATILLNSGMFGKGKVFDALLGDTPHELEMSSLLAEGAGHEWIQFNWLVSALDRHSAGG